MAILIRLIPLTILIAIIIFTISIKKGFSTAVQYAIGTTLALISAMCVVAFISYSGSSDEGDWPYILVILAAVVCTLGSAAGLLLGYYIEKRLNRSDREK